MSQDTEIVRPESAETHPSAPMSLLWRLGFAAAAGTSMWGLVWSMIGSRNHWLHSLFIPASLVLAVGLFILRNERHWARPSRRLRALLADIRTGSAPMDELEKINGGLAPLVPALREVFHDLKQHRIEMQQLNDEIRQRIAGRTNALERQLGSLRAQATRDSLTGLYNRRMFDVFLPKMLERCAADRVDLSLLMIDVDNFKALNDTLGHAAGDELLRDIAQLIRSGVREQDYPFRLGGDEFVVILPGQDPATANDVSKRLVELVDALAKPINVAAHPRLSIGVASLSESSERSPTDLVHRADKRLYEVKATRKRIPRQQNVRASA